MGRVFFTIPFNFYSEFLLKLVLLIYILIKSSFRDFQRFGIFTFRIGPDKSSLKFCEPFSNHEISSANFCSPQKDGKECLLSVSSFTWVHLCCSITHLHSGPAVCLIWVMLTLGTCPELELSLKGWVFLLTAPSHGQGRDLMVYPVESLWNCCNLEIFWQPWRTPKRVLVLALRAALEAVLFKALECYRGDDVWDFLLNFPAVNEVSNWSTIK